MNEKEPNGGTPTETPEGWRAALEDAVIELEAFVGDPKKRRPDRYDARALLVPLGLLLLDAGDADAGLSEVVERARDAGGRLGERWAEAVAGELSLACAEHVHAVDPRYLDLPNYDFEYTRRARRRLEARLRAATHLGLELPTALLGGVRAADERLAAHDSKATS